MDDSPLRKLAERLLLLHYRTEFTKDASLDLLPERLPDNLPVPLPIMDSWQLIGSAIFGGGGEGTSWVVEFEAPETKDIINRAVQTTLIEQGWQEHSWQRSFFGRNQEGFVATNWPFRAKGEGQDRQFEIPDEPFQMYLQRGDDKLILMLTVEKRANAPTEVSIGLQRTKGTPFEQFFDSEQQPRGITFPKLNPPEEATVWPGGSSSSDTRKDSHASATTAMSVESLETHYASQLQEAGWQKDDGKVEGRTAWSLWRIPGDVEGKGFLYVLQGLHDGERLLYVRAEADTDPFRAMIGGAASGSGSISTSWTMYGSSPKQRDAGDAKPDREEQED